ncbi:hypothetical protein [Paracoccus tibetensis]|uniref:Uncharacterized protein n=1 Tax=Paracoccus tibetensis TaxID=336292 RepID=A0A1G5JNQ3_9RHOB|nr:hypothetical protein [Paracoccus tibetensis]SCY89957.1 hypothetical protein SAMN05660710_03334 [Paracoccus tibetensis]
MTHFSVVQIDMHPAPYVAATGSARSAQILARLVGERCPGNVFGIRDKAEFFGPKSNGFIRDCARSFEVQKIAADELMAEADDNPDQLTKWHVYFYDSGAGDYRFKVNAYLDHDLRVRAKCEADPELIGRGVVYGDGPTMETLYLMLDALTASRETAA